MAGLRWVRVWHRRFGLTAAALVLVLSVTGLLLNHAASLNLDKSKVENTWILDWYGIAGVDETSLSFEIGDSTVSWAGGWLFLDELPLVGGVSDLVGAAALGELIVVTAPREILLFTREGELVERFLPVEFRTDVTAIGTLDQGLYVRVGEAAFSSNSDASVWLAVDTPLEAVVWSVGAPMPAQMHAAVNNHLRGEGLPVYRIILDLHSGNFFGKLGVLIMDGAAILLLILALSGVWIWWPRSP